MSEPALPAPLVTELLAAAGFPARGWRARPFGMGGGRINHHALVHLGDGRTVVVRAYGWPWDFPSPIDRLAKEVWLHDVLATAGVPVARILASARTTHGEALLMEHVPGELLGELAAREDASEIAGAWRAAGEALQGTHALSPPEGAAGRLTAGGVIPFDEGSWGAWHRSITAFHAEAAARALPRLPIDPDACVAVVERAAPILDARPRRIVHGDAGPWNALVARTGAGWRCTWLDWEFAQAGDPVWDLMRAALHHRRDIGGIPDAFFEGYGERPSEPAFSIYALGHHLWMAHDRFPRDGGWWCVSNAERYLADLPAHLARINDLVRRAPRA